MMMIFTENVSKHRLCQNVPLYSKMNIQKNIYYNEKDDGSIQSGEQHEELRFNYPV